MLERYLRGATQNHNESFNGLVWAMCPKEQFCGLEIVETAAALATAHFNHGAGAIGKVLQEMGCYHGHYTTGQLKAEDEEWIKQSIWKEKEEKKRGESRGEGGGRVWKKFKLIISA